MSLARKIFMFWLIVMGIAAILWQIANKGGGSQRSEQSETRPR